MNESPSLPLPTPTYMKNWRWIFDHYAELAARYATGWVAVHDGRVLAAGPGLGAVTDQAEKIAPPEHIAYQFVDDGSVIF